MVRKEGVCEGGRDEGEERCQCCERDGGGILGGEGWGGLERCVGDGAEGRREGVEEFGG